MSSVMSVSECPNCKQESLSSDFYYESGEEYMYCRECGYLYNFTFKRDEDGEFIKIDEDGDVDDIDNLQTNIESIENPFGAFQLEQKDGISQCGTLIDEADYESFVKQVKGIKDKRLKKAIVSRLVDGKIVKEVI